MESKCSCDPHCPGHEYDSFAGSYANHRPFDRYLYNLQCHGSSVDPTLGLFVQHPTVWGIYDHSSQPSMPVQTVPPITPMPSLLTETRYWDFGIPPMGVYPARPQAIDQPYPDRGVLTPGQKTTGRSEHEESNQHRDGLISRKLLPQEIYKPPRQQKEPGAPQTINFFVRGEKGIRLSDTLEGNWAGFEGRDDRLLFGDDRILIMLRLHFIGCPPWQSKISTTDYTTRRRPIARTKLASEVARKVKKFLERENAIGHNDRSWCDWKDTPLSNMYLTRLARVSAASWQPEIFVVQPHVLVVPV